MLETPPPDAETAWTDEQLASFGLKRGPTPDAVLSIAVDIERERRIALPLTVTTSAGSFSIDMDDAAQRNLNGLATAGLMLKSSGQTTVTPFRDHDNAMHELAPDDLIALGAQVMQRISTVYAESWAIKAMSPIPADFAADAHWP